MTLKSSNTLCLAKKKVKYKTCYITHILPDIDKRDRPLPLTQARPKNIVERKSIATHVILKSTTKEELHTTNNC